MCRFDEHSLVYLDMAEYSTMRAAHLIVVLIVIADVLFLDKNIVTVTTE